MRCIVHQRIRALHEPQTKGIRQDRAGVLRFFYERLTLASGRRPVHTTPIDRMNEKARHAPNIGQLSHICRP